MGSYDLMLGTAVVASAISIAGYTSVRYLRRPPPPKPVPLTRVAIGARVIIAAVLLILVLSRPSSLLPLTLYCYTIYECKSEKNGQKVDKLQRKSILSYY